MRKRNGLGKLYDRFTPHERFRLDVEATARGDEEESRRLVDACPRKSYAMADMAFTDHWRASEAITLALCIDLAQHLSKLKMTKAFRQVLPLMCNALENEAVFSYLDGHEAGAKRAWESARMEGDPPGWRDGEEEDEDPALEEALDAISARIQGVSARFVGFLEGDLSVTSPKRPRRCGRPIRSSAATIWGWNRSSWQAFGCGPFWTRLKSTKSCLRAPRSTRSAHRSTGKPS